MHYGFWRGNLGLKTERMERKENDRIAFLLLTYAGYWMASLRLLQSKSILDLGEEAFFVESA
jgi:hypothetical protein